MKKKSLVIPVTLLVLAAGSAALAASQMSGHVGALVIFNLFMAGAGVGMFGVFTILRVVERRSAT